MYELQNKYELAEQTYWELIRLRPGMNSPKARLGRLYLRTDREDDAYDLFKDIIDSARNPNEARIQVGLILF